MTSCINCSGVRAGGAWNSAITAFCFSSCSFIWRSSSAAFCASRSAIRRLISATENIPAAAGFAVPLLSDMTSPPFGTLALHQRVGMASNHQILVGPNDIGGDAAPGRAYAFFIFPVGGFVQLEAQPGAGSADRASDRRGILADPGGEHDAIEAAQRRGERADVAGDAVAEHFDCKTSARVVAG